MNKPVISYSDELDVLIYSTPELTADEVGGMSIFDMASEVVKRSRFCQLSSKFFAHNRLLLDALAARMNVSVFQAIAISVMLNDEDPMTISGVARHVNCSTMELRKHQEEFEALVRLRIVKRERRGRVSISSEAVKAYCHDEPYIYNVPENLTQEKLIFEIEKILCDYRNHCSHDDYDPLWSEIAELLDHNSHVPFARLFLEADNISSMGKVILLYFAIELFVHNRGKKHLITLSNDLRFEAHIAVSGDMEMKDLETRGFIEAECMDGVRDNEKFRLSHRACTELFTGLGLEKMLEDRSKVGMIEPTSLTAKQLFYNAEDEEQVAQLYNLLIEENFANVCQRLESEGLRKGFACLFYGAPGCGKTETVYQIARLTGRSIISVNVSDVLSMWVGESEKLVRGVFTSYREKVKRLDKAPILLFNEADAIIHKRTERIDRAVDQMANSLQNIILQEMESLEGIMIATTNLTQNLDKAFDRRFIYKIEFHKPSVQTKSKIWSSMIPTLTQAEADALAAEFDLTGGEIENVVRKSKVAYILTGEKYTLDTLRSICRNESIQMRDSAKKKIGF